MESEITNMIKKNVKIHKIVFVKNYTREEWLGLFKECHNHCQKDRKEFICVYCHYKKNLKMNIK
jgi:hypothetical protein